VRGRTLRQRKRGGDVPPPNGRDGHSDRYDPPFKKKGFSFPASHKKKNARCRRGKGGSNVRGEKGRENDRAAEKVGCPLFNPSRKKTTGLGKKGRTRSIMVREGRREGRNPRGVPLKTKKGAQQDIHKNLDEPREKKGRDVDVRRKKTWRQAKKEIVLVKKRSQCSLDDTSLVGRKKTLIVDEIKRDAARIAALSIKRRVPARAKKRAVTQSDRGLAAL